MPYFHLKILKIAMLSIILFVYSTKSFPVPSQKDKLNINAERVLIIYNLPDKSKVLIITIHITNGHKISFQTH